MLKKMLSKEPASMHSGKSRLFAGKKIFTITILTIALITFTNAQGITNTLGGNTAADKFIVENSDSEAGLVVTGEGNVGIGTTNPQSKLSVGGDGYSYSAIYGETSGSAGLGVYGYASGSSGYGVFGWASNSGASTNYGGFFTAAGSSGRGVYGWEVTVVEWSVMPVELVVKEYKGGVKLMIFMRQIQLV